MAFEVSGLITMLWFRDEDIFQDLGLFCFSAGTQEFLMEAASNAGFKSLYL